MMTFIFFASVVVYIVVGISFGVWMYNGIFDDRYQERLNYLSEEGKYPDTKEDRAYEFVKDRYNIAGWGWVSGIFWPGFILFGIVIYFFYLLGELFKLIGKFLPKPEAAKQYKLRQEEKKEKQKLEEMTNKLEESIQILKKENFDTEEAEKIVRFNRAKLESKSKA